METVMAVIETPKGSNQKYAYDPGSKFFLFKKSLPAGMVFPFDFGFVPGTKGEDEDPIDIIVISEFKSFPGCMMECKLIGCIAATQSEEKAGNKMIRNDRFIGIPVASTMFENIDDIESLPKKIIKELESFFINYNKEEGKQFRIEKKLGPTEAFEQIKKSKA